MRLLHVTDTHLGMRWYAQGAPSGWSRHDDHLQALERALEPAMRREVDLVVHSGDLFNRSKPPARVTEQAVALLRATAAHVPVVVMPGNHDRRGLVRHVPTSIPGLTVVHEPMRLVRAGLALAFVPFLPDAVAWAHAARRAVGGGVDALVAHQAFDSVRIPPSFVFRVGRQRDTVGEAHIPPGVRWVLCGHIHPRQTVEVGGATIVHPGSTERTAFSEMVSPKGYATWDFEGDVRHHLVDLPSRPLLVVSEPRDLDRVVPGAIVRVVPPDPALETEVLARGGWLLPSRPAVSSEPDPRPEPQIRLFG